MTLLLLLGLNSAAPTPASVKGYSTASNAPRNASTASDAPAYATTASNA